MRHRAFTLAEILIALTIIGVIVAITLPMINKFKPDITKVLYLQTNDALVNAISDIAFNEELYPKIAKINGANYFFEQYPFMNFQTAKFAGTNITGGANKLCRTLAKSFNIIEDIDVIAADTTNACSDTYTLYDTSSNTPFVTSFTNKNGVEIMVTTDATYPVSSGTNKYNTYIIIDINGSDADNGPNCVYNASSCKKPDRFTFKVSADGEVRATDAAGIYYLETRTSYKFTNITITDDIKTILTDNQKDFETIKLDYSGGSF